MSKLIIVAVPDDFNIDNVIYRIKNGVFSNDPKVHVISADSYQVVKEFEKQPNPVKEKQE